MRLNPLVSVVMLLALISAVRADAIPVEKGWRISQARKVLMANGWKSVQNNFRMSDGILERDHPPANEMSRAGYTEVENCSEGLVYCTFNYSKRGRCLQLVTQGELLPEFGPRSKPKVTGWRNQCPHKHDR